MIHTLIQRLARVSVSVVAGALVVGALLADVHTFVIVPAMDGAEPAQWTARLGIMLYFLVLPLCLLALWAPRRDSLGRVGAAAAVLLAFQVLCYLLLTGATVAWGLLLGRGDLGPSVMWVETVGVASLYLGVIIMAVRLLFAGRGNAVLGALILAGFLVSFAIPFGLTVAFVVLAAVLVMQTAGSRTEVVALQAH